MTRQWRRSLGIGSVLAILLPLLGVYTVTVSAHARLKSSVPAADTTVNTAPAQVVIIFTEETSPTKSGGSVAGPDGTTASTGFKVDLNDRTKMTIDLKPNLPNGKYTVKWNSFTEDDNGMADGTFAFTIQAAQQAATAAPAGTTPAATITTGSPASGITAPTATTASTATTAPTATRAATTPAAGSATTTTSGTSAPTATRAAASAVATGTGGATLPTTGNPSGGGGTPWLWIVVIGGSLALAAGFVLRRATRRTT